MRFCVVTRVINFWTYQPGPSTAYFLEFSYQPGPGIGTKPGPGSGTDWFLAGMRQVYTWYWNWNKAGITSGTYQADTGTRLVLRQVIPDQ